MPAVKTEELLGRIASGAFRTIVLKGLQGGSFCMLLECSDGSFIHENPNGSMKLYPKADHALTWLKRVAGAKQVIVDIELWRDDVNGTR
jgi:hypothetical protein